MSTAALSLARTPQRRWSRLAFGYLGVCVLLTAGCLLAGSTVATGMVFAAVAVATVAAVTTGLRVHRPDLRLPWQLVRAAGALFLLGGVLRVAMQPSSVAAGAALLPAVPTLAGYAAVGVGAALATWVLLIAPVANAGASLDAALVVNAAFPVVDAVLLTLLVHVAFTTAPGDRSFGLLTLCLGLILAGDVGYAVAAATSVSPPPEALDAPFLVGYGALGAAALHPSMVRAAAPQPRIAYRPRRRLPVLLAALLLVAAVLAVVPSHGPADRVVRATLLGLLLLGVLARSERAVRRHAAGEAAARHAASHDELTGLPNRVRFAADTQRLLDEQGPAGLSVVFLDLDDFKFVNDSYGHAVGDELLRGVADRLVLAVRPGDVVARHGGDEFIIAAPLGRAAATGLAQRLSNVFGDPFELSVGPVVVSACAGIARAGTTGRSVVLEELVREADAAMYHAKTLGRGEHAVYDDSLRRRAREQVETSTALREALRRGEFEVYYQPIVDIRSRATVGHEALLRWHRDGRLVGPATFIPMAEASAIIVPIGAWVLREALDTLVRRRQTEPELHVAVNVSARQLRGDELLATVTGLLAERGLPGSALWVELTETALVADLAAALCTLRGLQGLGVVICVDDFGTEYSALAYLQQFPVSVVKIDQSFVRQLGREHAGASLVAAVQHMASDLGLVTVAEGVETAEQEAELARLGCRLVQGYRYGRPAPAGAPGPVGISER